MTVSSAGARAFDGLPNAAAALQGAPVSTVDLDFMFRKTAGNLVKLKRLADDLGAIALQPYYPASGLYRLTRDGLAMFTSHLIRTIKASQLAAFVACTGLLLGG